MSDTAVQTPDSALAQPAKHKPLVFSGVQPTGNLHLGNYLGAIRNWVPMQEEMPCIFCVVDMHAITASFEPDLADKTREIAAAYIASGIDPERSIVFAQSRVPAHAELAWIFNCIARIGWLDRMTQFKEKAGKNKERSSAGLYVYPVLMAADILAYKATHVPVGEDQKQHLELARDIAQKFNNDLNEPGWFPQPEPMILGPTPRVMSLRDGKAKMSKSEPSDLSRINLKDSNDEIATKIRKARTDPEPIGGSMAEIDARPEASNLIGIYAALAGTEKEKVLAQFDGAQFSGFKNELAELLVSTIGPIRDRMDHMLKDKAEIDRILSRGAERADAIAAPILAETKRIVGFL
ncbi:MAG: tryptophan--tRNA ligase [Alphaproteobacteria bacterium]|nr:tryptophan--tRNA ligase [Alphaproteobacteria bacterium]